MPDSFSTVCASFLYVEIQWIAKTGFAGVAPGGAKFPALGDILSRPRLGFISEASPPAKQIYFRICHSCKARQVRLAAMRRIRREPLGKFRSLRRGGLFIKHKLRKGAQTCAWQRPHPRSFGHCARPGGKSAVGGRGGCGAFFPKTEGGRFRIYAMAHFLFCGEASLCLNPGIGAF